MSWLLRCYSPDHDLKYSMYLKILTLEDDLFEHVQENTVDYAYDLEEIEPYENTRRTRSKPEGSFYLATEALATYNVAEKVKQELNIYPGKRRVHKHMQQKNRDDGTGSLKLARSSIGKSRRNSLSGTS